MTPPGSGDSSPELHWTSQNVIFAGEPGESQAVAYISSQCHVLVFLAPVSYQEKPVKATFPSLVPHPGPPRQHHH
ncbi:hypothetical protein J5N97_021067 [Dioscorea zingiberensis]|uniref:Uncharacterized protein n=1 Tax=Dioscorea zingiberensis TaxID=325984 RepID=A0A9D5CGZ5_9LILI|nr:hypothetical protein J5N97_021067 [Dioscorea zingiberensis]